VKEEGRRDQKSFSTLRATKENGERGERSRRHSPAFNSPGKIEQKLFERKGEEIEKLVLSTGCQNKRSGGVLLHWTMSPNCRERGDGELAKQKK